VPTDPSTSGSDEWVAQLPAAIEACAVRWNLVLGERLPGGLVGHVFACTTREGEAAVLKLNPPSADEFAGTPEQEAAALGAWRGRGAVELLAVAADLRALLTRRALPGTPPAEGCELDARRDVAGVLAKLFEATIPPVAFAPLAEAVDRHLVRKIAVSGEAREMLDPLIEQARVSARHLATSARQQVLLHGDVMDKNLLRDHDDLLAIDPMPHVGDPHSDIGFWAATRSPARDLDVRAAEIARLLDCDSDRAAQWAAIYAVGSACENWRPDTTELRAWVRSARARELLSV
jgi:streptomycin 6-kinase